MGGSINIRSLIAGWFMENLNRKWMRTGVPPWKPPAVRFPMSFLWEAIPSHGRCMALGLPALPYGAVAPAAEKSSRNLMDIYSYMYINILCIYLDKIYHVHTCEVAFGSFSKRIR